MGLKKLLLSVLLAGSTGAWANILPPNHLDQDDQLNSGTGLTEEEFNTVLDRIETVYAPIVRTVGGYLKINRHWELNTVNATASQALFIWKLDMYGGFARRPEITVDAFTLAACHELGHHLGGYPFSYYWQANEGQADYFAVQSCARVMWGAEKNTNALARSVIPPSPKMLCDSQWGEVDAQNLCYRTMLAGQALANLFSFLDHHDVDWDTHDASEVSRTNDDHPLSQCRFDTYMSGAICPVKFASNQIPGKRILGVNNEWAEEQSAAQTCMTQEHFQVGTRPLCWFKSLRSPVASTLMDH